MIQRYELTEQGSLREAENGWWMMVTHVDAALAEKNAEIAALTAALALVPGEPGGWIWEDEFTTDPATYEKWVEAGREAQPFYFNSVASPAPLPVAVKAILSHFEKMQRMASMWLAPDTYIASFPKGDIAFDTVFGVPERLHSEEARRQINKRRDDAFISDIIRMLDGPEQREAEKAIRSALSSPVGGMEERTPSSNVAEYVERAALGARTVAQEPVASGETVMKSDVEQMIRDWQVECKEHPALHNQGNVLLGRLRDIKPSLAMSDFLTGMDSLSPLATEPMSFSSDDDALEFLKLYGHEEHQNGVIRGDWRSFDKDCRAAVQYLCDEWDFVFENIATPQPAVVKPQCCMCGKKGLSTVEGDGGTECELSDGRWTCSVECWDKAVSPTPASDIAALREENERLLDELKKARREANDNVYMAHAYRVMLGPIASELAKKWEDYGVVRQHTSWGPDAHKLTGEERAKVLLDAFVLPPSALQHVAKGERG